jgi:hypothetical protein
VLSAPIRIQNQFIYLTITHLIPTKYGWYLHGTLRNQTQPTFILDQVLIRQTNQTQDLLTSLDFYPSTLTLAPDHQIHLWTSLIPLSFLSSDSSTGELLIQSKDQRTVHIPLIDLSRL